MIKYVLFDLDGTLLPMDQDVFTKAYMKELTTKMLPYGFEPKTLVAAVWNGMKAMLANQGTQTNEKAFWESFQNDLGENILEYKEIFDEFYRGEFNNLEKVCAFTPNAKETVELVISSGATPIVATLPAFSREAIEARLRWAGLDKDSFLFYTSYETCSYCKPNPGYYREILKKSGCKAEECIMIGNNVEEDMIAGETGMKLFLLTDCLINEKNKDISLYPHGGYSELKEHLKNIL